MRVATFAQNNNTSIGIVDDAGVLDLRAAWSRYADKNVPVDMLDFIARGQSALESARAVLRSAQNDKDPSLWHALEDLRLCSPIPRPRKNVFCVGRNYKAHIEEGARGRGRAVVFPTVPEFFSKPPTAVIGPEDEIRIGPGITQQLDYEVELALVIGRKCRDVTRDSALDAVFGYTVVNDVTARDLQARHGQWFKGKGLDTSCPIGPWIVTRDAFGDPSGHRITLRVNEETRQDSNTGDLLFDCATIVASLSEGLTLEPGDIIATGTPSGVALGMSPQAWLQDGDVIEAEVEGIGILRNPVRAS